jgi:hypothetical protein
MNRLTKFEDLSTEIFIEILDYLHAIDIFAAFGSLNRRISSILRSIYLSVIITSKHHPWHIKLLSNHLIIHADQVISFSINDDTQDRSSAINLLFRRHRFDNLRSCRLKISCSFYKLTSFIQQLESLTNLQSVYIIQPYSLLSKSIKHDSNYSVLSCMRSTALRSVGLLYHYDYCGTPYANNTITSNLTYLELMLHTSSDNGSIYSLIHILRFCPVLRRLRLIVKNGTLVDRNNVM